MHDTPITRRNIRRIMAESLGIHVFRAPFTYQLTR